MVGREAPESGQAPEEPSTAPKVTLDEVKAALKRHREAIKSLFVRYEEEAVPLIDPDLAFRWDVMQIRMKTEEHEAFEGAKRYRRTIHRGTSEGIGRPDRRRSPVAEARPGTASREGEAARDGRRRGEGEGIRPAAQDLPDRAARLRSGLRWTALLEEVPPGLPPVPGLEGARHVPGVAEPRRGLPPGDRPRHLGPERGRGGQARG